MKNTPHFVGFINKIKSAWEGFPKNSINPVAEFEPILDTIFKQHQFIWVDDDKFVSRALNVYRERLVDDFTDSGLNVNDFIIQEAFVLGLNSFDNYADLFKLSVQSDIL